MIVKELKKLLEDVPEDLDINFVQKNIIEDEGKVEEKVLQLIKVAHEIGDESEFEDITFYLI